MVEKDERLENSGNPPPLAVAVLSRAALSDDEDCMLGDLNEGFRIRAKRSLKAARQWYWRQTLASVPHLVVHRFHRMGARRLGVLALSSLLAFFAITYWDIFIARNGAQFIAAQSQGAPLGMVRAFYFAIFVFGAALSGIMAAAISFRKNASFKSNAMVAIGPVCMILTALLLVRLSQFGAANLLPYLLFRTAIAGLALLAGAYVFQKISAR